MHKLSNSLPPPFWLVLLVLGLHPLLSGCVSHRGPSAYPPPPNCSVAEPRFVHTISRTLHTRLVGGNKISILLNGDEFFPAMLEAIRSARNSITFENYIWRPGVQSEEFVAAFIERAQAGVPVHITTDALGSAPLPEVQIRQMRQAGIQIRKHNPLRVSAVFRLNHRTHRRLLIVDGQVGFIGGGALDDSWMGDGQTPPKWRDTHYRVEGPVVAQMQAAFLDNWAQSRDEILSGPGYFPELAPGGDTLVQCFISGPGPSQGKARYAYLHAIAAARHHLRLAHSFFIPDKSAMDALLAARARGVTVELILPAQPHVRIAHHASRARWQKLLEAGVQIYAYLPTRYHCKTLIVDDLWVSVGTVNFDSRSFQINDEVNLNVQDRDFAARQIQIFDDDKAHCRTITLEELQDRAWTTKVVDKLAGLFQSQL